jgi:hypothetical protein
MGPVGGSARVQTREVVGVDDMIVRGGDDCWSSQRRGGAR